MKIFIDKTNLFFVLFVLFTFSVYSQYNNTSHGISWGVSYTGDVISNLHGGKKNGSNYLGLAHLDLFLDTEAAKMWSNGGFYINFANTHGGMPSQNLIGDLQVVSNIEAGPHTYVQEFWYKHKIKNVELIFGLQDLNEEIANIEAGEHYIHSSLGILPIISINLDAPVFPLTTPGITMKWKINTSTMWLNALFDGTPTNLADNPFNIKWKFRKGQGVLAISELQKIVKVREKPGKLKAGVFIHNHLFDNMFFKSFPDSLNTNITGGYASYEQEI